MNKACLVVDKDGKEFIYAAEPHRNNKNQTYWRSGILKEEWAEYEEDSSNAYMRVELCNGSVEKLIGRRLTWEDEPVEIEEG